MECKCDKAGSCYWHQAITTNETFEACREGTTPERADPAPCIHLGTVTRHKPRRIEEHEEAYDCYLHGQCTLKPNKGWISDCEHCKDYMTVHDQDLKTRFKDPLRITDRTGQNTTVLRNMLSGASAFLVCGGPSLKEVDYRRIGERGVFSLGVNNVAGFAPVSAFTCSDPPLKFHHGIFLDPKIMKFMPTPKLRGVRARLKKKVGNEFSYIQQTTATSPNCWGYERRSWLMPDDTWFCHPGAAWGNHKVGVMKTGQPKTVCTMLLGLRLLQYLGARRIFLLGVDFYMDPDVAKTDELANYSFGEKRDPGACNSNNAQFRVVNHWLCKLRPIFEKYGFETYNCNQKSRLRAFDYVPFETALEDCRGDVPREPFDLYGFYEKKKVVENPHEKENAVAGDS